MSADSLRLGDVGREAAPQLGHPRCSGVADFYLPTCRRKHGGSRAPAACRGEGPAAVLFVFRLLQASSIAGGVAELSKALDPGGVERHVVARCCSVVVGRPAGQVRSSSRPRSLGWPCIAESHAQKCGRINHLSARWGHWHWQDASCTSAGCSLQGRQGVGEEQGQRQAGRQAARGTRRRVARPLPRVRCPVADGDAGTNGPRTAGQRQLPAQSAGPARPRKEALVPIDRFGGSSSGPPPPSWSMETSPSFTGLD